MNTLPQSPFSQYLTQQNLLYAWWFLVVLWLFIFFYISMAQSSSTTIPTSTLNIETSGSCEQVVQAYIAEYARVNASSWPAIKVWDEVFTHYIGRMADGSVFDTSIEQVAQACDLYNPGRDYGSWLSFTVGAWQMIPWFDAAIVGMQVGAIKTVTLAPADAYGDYDPNNTQDVPLDQLPAKEDGTDYASGDILYTMFGEFRIRSVSGNVVTVDTNHKFAWKELIFDIMPRSIVQATSVSK